MAAATVDAAAANTPRPDTSGRTWVQHVLQRGESLQDVAERYGVELDELRRFNDLGPKAKIERGMVLRIHARSLPRPRQRVRVSVGEKDTWADVAMRYGVTVDDLKRTNARFAKRRRPKGLRLRVWIDSRVLPPGSGEHGPTPPQFDVPTGGVSVGRPHRGRLQNGVALPESDQYTVRLPRIAYGTTLAVTAIRQAIASFRYQTGFEGQIVIGAMSRRTGRRLRPHRSHQSGRDADIRLPAMVFADGEHDLSAQDIDWPAAWSLIQAFVDTEVVAVVFLERRHFRRLRRAGREMGATEDQIQHVMSHVRHAKGHTAHFHVRFICSPLAERCRD